MNNSQATSESQKSSFEPTESSRLLSDEENGLRSYQSYEMNNSGVFLAEEGVDNQQQQNNQQDNQLSQGPETQTQHLAQNYCNNNDAIGNNNHQQDLQLQQLQQQNRMEIRSQLSGNVASEIIKRKGKPPKYRRQRR